MPSDATQPPTPKRPSRAQRIMVLGFLFAFALTILTVLLTGLATKSSRSPVGVPAAPADRR